MLKRLTFILVFCESVAGVNAQDTIRQHGSPVPGDSSSHRVAPFDCVIWTPISEEYGRSSLTAEIGGNGGVYSINYQRGFWDIYDMRLLWTAGVSVLPRGVLIVDFPVSLNFQKSFRGRHHWIIGTGQVLILSNTKGGYIRGTFRAAYRYNFKGRRAFMEFAYTPFYSYLYNFQWDNWFGASFGWNLKPKKS